jgi:hypothetical protein
MQRHVLLQKKIYYLYPEYAGSAQVRSRIIAEDDRIIKGPDAYLCNVEQNRRCPAAIFYRTSGDAKTLPRLFYQTF